MGLCEGGETIVSLVPEWGIIVRDEFFIELDVPQGIYFYASSGRVPSEFTVVGEFVPLVIDKFAIVWDGVGVDVERTRFEPVTCVGAPEIS